MLCYLGVDKKTTILDYMVKSLIDKNESRLLEITDDLSILESVVKLSGSDILKEMEGVEKNFVILTKELEKCQSNSNSDEETAQDKLYYKRLQENIERFSTHRKNVQRYENIMRNKITEAVEYFGEEQSNCDTLKIFGTLCLFCKSITASKVTVERRARSEARNNANASRERSLSRDHDYRK